MRDTDHPTHPIAGEIILEGYLLRVRGWGEKSCTQYACVVGGHHGTPPDKSKIDEEKNRKTNVGLDSEAWISVQDKLIDFVADMS
ncbi:MAG: HD domain-containing protein [Bifidobacterium sp.]